MHKPHLGYLGVVLGMLTLSSTPAMAHILTSATANVDCQGYSLTVNATELEVKAIYTIDYTFTAICDGGSPITIPGTITFKASADTVTEAASGVFENAVLSGNCMLTGSATLTSSGSTVAININGAGTCNPAPLFCPATPPSACVIPPSGTAIPGSPVSWNGFTAPAGSVVWVHAHISGPRNVPRDTISMVDFTGVSLEVNGVTYVLPNGQIVFDPAVSTPTTVVNAGGSWTTTVNPRTSGDIFFDGDAIPVDSNLKNGGHGNTGSTFSFTTNSSISSLAFSWQWSAAVYTSWPGNAAADISPVQANGLQSGAPRNTAVQKHLIQGPRGGGGSNFTGSWSGTGHGVCP